jgi:hypothetical protein
VKLSSEGDYKKTRNSFPINYEISVSEHDIYTISAITQGFENKRTCIYMLGEYIADEKRIDDSNYDHK